MNRKRYMSILLIAMIVASMLLYAGCQKDDGTNKADDNVSSGDNNKVDQEKESNADGRSNSEEKLADLKVNLVEGQDYKSLAIDIEDFELNDLEGNKVKLSDYSGKIVFLNFWATWCPPCRAEMPHMQEIHEEYEDVAILAVNSTSTELRGGRDSKKAKGQVKKFIDSEGYTFPVLLDADDEVSMTYNAIFPLTGIPTTFVIDKEGTIRYVRPGTFIDKEYIEQFIKLASE